MEIQKVRPPEVVAQIKRFISPAQRLDQRIPLQELIRWRGFLCEDALDHPDVVVKSKNYPMSGNSYYINFSGALKGELVGWGKNYFASALDPRFEVTSVRAYYLENTPSFAGEVHVDAPDDLKLDYPIYKNIIIPFCVNDGFADSEWEKSKTIFFEQYYFHNGCWYSQQLPKDYWKLTAPERVENKSDTSFPQDIYEEHLSHLNYEDLADLSFAQALSWKAGSIYILDGSQLHCANNYLQQGIKRRGHLLFHTKIDVNLSI